MKQNVIIMHIVIILHNLPLERKTPVRLGALLRSVIRMSSGISLLSGEL